MSERAIWILFGVVWVACLLYTAIVTGPQYFNCLGEGGVPVQVWGGYACADGNG